MHSANFASVRERMTHTAQQLLAPDQLAVTITAALLSLVFVLAVGTIVRGRRRRVVPLPSPSNPSGFTRWLTPLGMKSIPAAPVATSAVAARPRRKTVAMKTIKVSTPVSKVPTRALRKAGADALEIARRTGLARDAVAMMMANANPQAAAQKQTVAKIAVAAPTATRTASSERAMTAPSAYGNSARTQPPPSTSRSLGTQFNARIS
jgi:hypothetical protein